MAKHVRNKVFQYILSYSIKPYVGPTSLQACYNKILGITAGMLVARGGKGSQGLP